MRQFGYSDRLKENLSHCEVVEYDSVPANPDFECVRQGIDIARRAGITVVVALGGGSSMDAGKAIAFLATQSASLDDYLAIDAVGESVKGLGFVAIPTTSGTGSEVTPWASIWDRDNGKKYSLADERMFPDCAIIDPSLTLNLPPDITAATGLDALCHAVEAYWSLNSQPVSDLLAIGAIELIRDHLVGAYLEAIEKELGSLGKPREVETLYVGGGTPTHLAPELLERLLDVVLAWHPLAGGGELF